MIWAFVDYENVGSLESLDLEQYQRLIIFCGPRHRKLNLGEIPTSSFCHLELIRMASTGNNNLDFHLAFYLGVHHLEAGKDVEFHVISNDKGFDGVIQHLVEMGRKCSRVGRAKKKTTKKAVAKKTSAKKTVAKKTAVKKVTAKKKVAKKSGAKQAATKKVAVKQTVKIAAKKKADMESEGEVMPKLVSRPQLARVRKEMAKKLEACVPENRPSNRDKLINWIEDKMSDKTVSPTQVFDSLKGVGCILDNEDGITYDIEDKSIPPPSNSDANESAGPIDYPHKSINTAMAIKALDPSARPRTLDKLETWIRSTLGVTVFVARGIYNKLIREECIQIDEDWISYDFDKAL